MLVPAAHCCIERDRDNIFVFASLFAGCFVMLYFPAASSPTVPTDRHEKHKKQKKSKQQTSIPANSIPENSIQSWTASPAVQVDFGQTVGGHARTAVYLKRIWKRADDNCWFCQGPARMTRSHVLLHYPSEKLRSARSEAWEGKNPGVSECC